MMQKGISNNMAKINDSKKTNSSNWKFSLGLSLLSMVVIISAFLILLSPGNKARATPASFTFTTTGDYGSSQNTINNMRYIGNSVANGGAGAAFNLGLGDFNYDTTVSADTWYNTYAKPYLPSTFPFEIVAGDHDSQLAQLAVDLPDRIGLGTGSTAYAQQYYFDYPPSPATPLARFIMVSPVVLSTYHYAAGGASYKWVSQRITDAHQAGIPWVVVGMAEGCLFIYGPSDSKACASASSDLLNLLLSQKVDLILQAHVHAYLRSKQLALGPNCTTINTTGYNPQCVVDSSSSLSQGKGTVIVNTGTGGKSLVALNGIPGTASYDPKAGYFAQWMGSNANPTYGVSQFTLSATQLSMQYVSVTPIKGTFGDSFTITSGSSATPSPSPTTSGGTAIAQDTFQRPNQSLWGNASDGQTWAGDANSQPVFSIVGNQGVVSNTAGTSYGAVLGPQVTDSEDYASGSLSSFTNSNFGNVLRWTSGNNWYKAYIDGANLTIQMNVNGVLSTLASVPFAATAGTSYTIHFRVVGSTLTANAWASSGSEPSGWMVTASDSSLPTGSCGMHFLTQSGTATITSFLANTLGSSITPTATSTPGSTLGMDSFQRPNQTFWGTASDGQTWAANANSYKVFSISNNTGLVTASSNNNYFAVLGPAATNASVRFSGSASSFTGIHMGAILRWTSNQNWYEAYIDGTNLVIDKKVAGTLTKLRTIPFSATTATSYTLLFNISGNSLNASVWPTNGGSQPGTWMLTATDTSLASGNCGLHMVVQTGTTLTFTSFEGTAP